MPTDGFSPSISPPHYIAPCAGPALQIRAIAPTQLFGLSRGGDVTTSLSNGLPETGTEAHTVCHVYIVRYKAQDERIGRSCSVRRELVEPLFEIITKR